MSWGVLFHWTWTSWQGTKGGSWRLIHERLYLLFPTPWCPQRGLCPAFMTGHQWGNFPSSKGRHRGIKEVQNSLASGQPLPRGPLFPSCICSPRPAADLSTYFPKICFTTAPQPGPSSLPDYLHCSLCLHLPLSPLRGLPSPPLPPISWFPGRWCPWMKGQWDCSSPACLPCLTTFTGSS